MLGTRRSVYTRSRTPTFQPTRSRRARRVPRDGRQFQPTRSRRARPRSDPPRVAKCFNPRAREERDGVPQAMMISSHVSTHALAKSATTALRSYPCRRSRFNPRAREERDPYEPVKRSTACEPRSFQPTRSRRARHASARALLATRTSRVSTHALAKSAILERYVACRDVCAVSTHALAKSATVPRRLRPACRSRARPFQPTRSRRARRVRMRLAARSGALFQPTRSRRARHHPLQLLVPKRKTQPFPRATNGQQPKRKTPLPPSMSEDRNLLKISPLKEPRTPRHFTVRFTFAHFAPLDETPSPAPNSQTLKQSKGHSYPQQASRPHARCAAPSCSQGSRTAGYPPRDRSAQPTAA